MTIQFTPDWAIPYPEGEDTPDVPRDVAAVANATEDALNQVNLSPPIGGIMMWPGAAAPTNWFLCNGPTADCMADDFPELAALLGEFGVTGQVNLPLTDGRAILGVGSDATSPGHTNHALLTHGGEEKHTLTAAELPTHTHPAGITNPATQYMAHGDTGESTYLQFGGAPGVDKISFSFQSPHFNTGGGSSQNNLPPFLALNFIIRAK